MGAIFLALILLSLISSSIALKKSIALRNARREFTRELEEEKRRLSAPAIPPPASALSSTGNEMTPNPAPVPALTSGPPPQSGPISGPLFSIFGPTPIKNILDPTLIPVVIKNVQSTWSDKALTSKFEIHYVRDDGGNQQGWIFLLARGPDAVFVHPKAALEPIGSPALISLKAGEHFSVSRLRVVEARFENLNRERIQSIEALIIGKDGQILIHEALPIK